MSGFEEFLQDYEAHELEEIDKFIKRLDEGKVKQNETYPPKERFINLKEPIAQTSGNIWGVVPFYGSTIIRLIPRDNKKIFDETHEKIGFNSRKIDEMIDMVKETGRIQFATTTPPTYYKNLEFLEPLFRELKPPTLNSDIVSLIGPELDRKYNIEFNTLAQFNFNDFIEEDSKKLGNSNTNYLKTKLIDYADRYAVLKALGHEELADEIGTLMIIDPSEAQKYLAVLSIITQPHKSLFKSIMNIDSNISSTFNNLGKPYGIELKNKIPYEIGKFLLNKMVHYPETLDGCMRLIQEYDDHELYKVLGALNEGVQRKKIDIIEDKKIDMSEILDNVWEDTHNLKIASEGLSYGVSLNLSLIGELATGLSGVGVMAGLGFQVADKFMGSKTNFLSERISKLVSPDYLVTIYDFKKKHTLTDKT